MSETVEEWGVDQQLISKLKEQYQREREIGKKGMQSMPASLFSSSAACYISFSCFLCTYQLSAEVAAQADNVILYPGKSELFVQIKLTEKRCRRRLIMLCCPRMSLEPTNEKTASVSGPFIKCSSRKTMKSKMRLPEYCCLHPRVLIPS